MGRRKYCKLFRNGTEPGGDMCRMTRYCDCGEEGKPIRYIVKVEEGKPDNNKPSDLSFNQLMEDLNKG